MVHKTEQALDEQSATESESTADLLYGIPDFSHGQALAFFTDLDAPDREITQWYVSQGIGPWQIEAYVGDLVRGYAVADPNREYAHGMVAAHTELGRINRFLQIFLDSKTYFPWLGSFNVAVRDESDKYEGSIDVTGWSSFGGPKNSMFDLKWHKEAIRNSNLRGYLELANSFVDDALSAPHVFDQEKILAEARDAAQATLMEN